MNMIKEARRKIRELEEYNLSRIKQEGLFPWAKSIITIRSIIKRDYLGDNILKALISGQGRGTDYKIKGSNLIKFLEKCGAGITALTKTKIK